MRSEQKYLRHMNKDDGHHEVGAPSMHRANEPAKHHLMIQGLQAAPCFSRRGNIDKCQQNSSHQLQEKDGERGAAEHVEPARRISRHRMFGDLANGCRELQTMVKPFTDLLDHAHGGFSADRLATGSPGVGNWPALIVSTPFSILYGYSKSPRSGGPDARAPSR